MPRKIILIILILLSPIITFLPSVSKGVETSARPELHRASNPQCGIFGTGAAAGAAASLIGGTALIIGGVIKIDSGVGIPVGIGMVVGGTANIVGAAYGGTVISMYLVCRYSFARHPVLYYQENGDYKECANPVENPYIPKGQATQKLCVDQKYKRTDSYKWPQNGSPSSDYIEMCYRSMLGGVGTADIDPREIEVDKLYPTDAQISVLSNIRNVGGPLECKRFKAGDKKKVGIAYFKAYEQGDKICISTTGFAEDADFWPTFEVGCHLREPSPPSPMCKASIPVFGDDNEIKSYDNSACFSCYISEACYSQTGLVAKAQLPMTSLVIQCIKDSLFNIIAGDCLDPQTLEPQETFLSIAQSRLKDAVRAVIALAIMLFGFKVMMGAVQNHSEYIVLVIKISFVLFLSIGDGIKYYYDQLIGFSTALSDLVLSAGGNPTICNYDSRDYLAPVIKSSAGKLKSWERDTLRKIYKSGAFREFSDLDNNRGFFSELSDDQLTSFTSKIEFRSYSYIAPWDRLDCRLMFYLGSSVKKFAVLGGGAAVGALAVAALPVLWIFLIPLAAIFGGNIVLALASLLFMIMIILMIIWMVHLFILSILAVSVLALLAPIFAPMMLFQVTKNFFDGWIKEIMAYSLYPVILFTFLSLVFSVFDKIYFGDMTFAPSVVTDAKNTKTTYAYSLEPEDQCNLQKNQNVLACLVEGMNFITKPLILGINVTATDDATDSSGEIWKGFLKMALMGFLFYHFLNLIGGLAAELSGSFRADVSQHTQSVGSMGSKLASVGAKGLKGVKSAGEAAKNKVSGGGSSGKDSASSGGKDGDTSKRSGGPSGGN